VENEALVSTHLGMIKRRIPLAVPLEVSRRAMAANERLMPGPWKTIHKHRFVSFITNGCPTGVKVLG
jgi:hypothetical protein